MSLPCRAGSIRSLLGTCAKEKREKKGVFTQKTAPGPYAKKKKVEKENSWDSNEIVDHRVPGAEEFERPKKRGRGKKG